MKPLLVVFSVVVCSLTVGCQGRGSSDVARTGSAVGEDVPSVTAYYFHRTARCPACLGIEVRAAEAIEKHFAEELGDGRLVWMPFNLDEPGGEAYEKEFDLHFNSLVLSRTEGGRRVKHRTLDKVWSLAGDGVQFEEYVKNEVERFLDE